MVKCIDLEIEKILHYIVVKKSIVYHDVPFSIESIMEGNAVSSPIHTSYALWDLVAECSDFVASQGRWIHCDFYDRKIQKQPATSVTGATAG